MKKIEVVVYGGKNINGGGCGCGCAGCGATTENVALEYQRMVDIVSKKFNPDEVEFKFTDTTEKDLAEFPIIERVIMNGYSFPVTVINDTPYLAGAIDSQAIEEIVADLREEAQEDK
jgi:disulfide oxidoreductase YuzD